MPNIDIVLDVDAIPKDQRPDPAKVIHLTGGFKVIRVPHGMQSGATSLMLEIKLPDGRVILQETSLQIFLATARALGAYEERN